MQSIDQIKSELIQIKKLNSQQGINNKNFITKNDLRKVIEAGYKNSRSYSQNEYYNKELQNTRTQEYRQSMERRIGETLNSYKRSLNYSLYESEKKESESNLRWQQNYGSNYDYYYKKHKIFDSYRDWQDYKLKLKSDSLRDEYKRKE